MTASEAHLADLFARFPSVIANGPATSDPRFRLFHAPSSVCSQKVRTVLHALGQPYHSHLVNIFAGESYAPAYVRLRAQACVEAGHRFSAHHSGSTSVAGTGCDACVVPTLIDRRDGRVIVDSHRICRFLCEEAGGDLLSPGLAAEIAAEMEIVDALPNYPLLAAKVAAPTADGGNTFAQSKVDRCEALIAAHGEDPLLAAAYRAKRDKEASANAGLFGAEAIAQAEAAMQAAFAALEGRLSEGRAYLHSDRLTLADIFWAVELVRTEDLGQAGWIEALPKLSRYYAALRSEPAIRGAILDWPGARLKLRH